MLAFRLCFVFYQEVLQYHEDDDQILACRGINFFQQMELRKESKVRMILYWLNFKVSFPQNCRKT